MSSMLLQLVVIVHIAFSDYGKKCNPLDYGAKGDGKKDDTSAIQKAMDDCYLNNKNGGKVVLPSGKSFLSFPLNATSVSNIGFEIEANSTLIISSDRAHWPNNTDFLSFKSCENIKLFGGGVVNGNGSIWWANADEFRPHTVSAKDCNRMLITNLTFNNPPSHCLEIGADNTEISFVQIFAPITSDNTDAVDVHGSPFWIHDCYFDNGDDNVAVHANDTLVENCRFGTGHGASIGSLGQGWYKNITFDNITFDGTTNGIRIKTHSGAGPGKVWDAHWTNLRMNNVKDTIVITQFYDGNVEEQSYLWIDGIYIENVTSVNSTNAGSFQCQNSTPCHHIELNNVKIEASKNDGQFVCEQAFGNAKNTEPKSCLIPDS